MSLLIVEPITKKIIIMRNLVKFGCLFFSMALFSCSDNDIEGLTSSEVQAEEVKTPFTKMSKEQAALYASLFSNIDDGEEVKTEYNIQN